MSRVYYPNLIYRILQGSGALFTICFSLLAYHFFFSEMDTIFNLLFFLVVLKVLLTCGFTLISSFTRNISYSQQHFTLINSWDWPKYLGVYFDGMFDIKFLKTYPPKIRQIINLNDVTSYYIKELHGWNFIFLRWEYFIYQGRFLLLHSSKKEHPYRITLTGYSDSSIKDLKRQFEQREITENTQFANEKTGFENPFRFIIRSTNRDK